MKKAIVPGIAKNNAVLKNELGLSKNLLEKMAVQLSNATLAMHSVTAITGANQKMVAAGLSMPIFLFFNKSWVKLHRRPPSALAEVTSMNPRIENSVSRATIMRTPITIRIITPTSRSENLSRPKSRANNRTNINEDDLHIAFSRISKDWKVWRNNTNVL